MKAKRITLAIVLVLICVLLTACSTPEGTYKQAQTLLSQGKYTEAAEKFESLGSYEDATTLTMYCKACALCESGNFEAGIAGFESLGNYKDCSLRISYYTARSWDDNSVGTTEFEWMNRAKSIYNENPLYLDSAERITALDARIETAKTTLYDNAVAADEQGQYSTAIATFQRLGNYKDSAKRATYYGIRADEEALAGTTDETACDAVAARYTNMGDYLDCADRATTVMTQATAIRDDKYNVAVTLMNEGKYDEARIAFSALGDYKDAHALMFESWNDIAVRDVVSVGYYHIIGLNADGTVVAKGENSDGQCNISNWMNIIAVGAGNEHTVGLRVDGTVVAVGDNTFGQCNVSNWTDIVAISAGDDHTVGLKVDGTVVATGWNYHGQCNVSNWTDIVAVAAGYDYIVGLKADGTVVVVGQNNKGQRNVDNWTDIVAINATAIVPCSLKSNGTVVTAGKGDYKIGDGYESWTDIVAVSGTPWGSVIGLKSDGTVVTTDNDSIYDVSNWTDIVAISVGANIVGLKQDGTIAEASLVIFGSNSFDINGWQLKQVNKPNR